ncbi:MAG: MBL fold metallo-hydrolase [Gemmatimonadetes bacterium]|nr:MBL fold metallo-hydrolase [Gemmatimonadota bacterium]
MLRSNTRRIEERLRAVERAFLPDVERRALPPGVTIPTDQGDLLDGAEKVLRERSRGKPDPALAERIATLRSWRSRAPGTDGLRDYSGRFGFAGVLRFDTSSGHRIYRIEAETLPRHINNLHLILGGEGTLLHDAGSFLDSTWRDLGVGFAAIRSGWGEQTRIEDVDDIVVSHSHIDHFGGCAWFKENTGARIHVHELDFRVLVDFDERIAFAEKELEIFFERAGLSGDESDELLSLYVSTKALVRSCEVDRILRDGDFIQAGIEVIHTPGHCPGQICLRLGDHLLTADHVLPDISPHVGPESITPHTGVTHYLEALEKVASIEGIRRALPGHGEAIDDLYGRVDRIMVHHDRRLHKVITLCEEPRTVLDICAGLFGRRTGYHRILALQETGAHVEHLHMTGRLKIANLDEIECGSASAYRYMRREGIETGGTFRRENAADS